VGIFAHLVGRLTLWLFGWRAVGELPPDKRLVLIAHPHTTNWDIVFMLGVGWTLRIKINWVGKRSLFRWPYGWLMRAWGGFMIDRSKGSNQVQLIADHIKSQEQILIVVAPSGTRSKTDYWKSGFYYIALTANVPVLCCFLDYARKEGGIGTTVHLTGNMSADMDQIRAFYADKTGKRPEKATLIRLKDEIAEPPEIKT
jgi:1-acyl-sn-glycerol-3-phosphate acyltransferase